MRNKVILIKGYAGVARQITLAEFERINADHVVVICALKRPQFLPPTVSLDLSSIELKTKQILDHWKEIENEHYLASEYASLVLEKGSDDIKVVEGESLEIPWFYETIKTMHKHFGQHIVEGEVITHREDGLWFRLDQQEWPMKVAIENLKPLSYLG